MTRSRHLAAACGVLLLVSMYGLAQPAAQADDSAPKVLLMLDSSGSMKDADPSGGTKMDAAKKSLIRALDSIPSNAEVGLRVYGADADGNGASGACSDSRLAHPVGALDKAGLSAAINQFQPRGDTPIAYSLKEGAKDLGDGGKRHVILVSDGEETCSPDPCQEIRSLIAGGVSLQIDTVGFAVQDKAREQLSCIAEAGGGTYYEAKDATALESSLQRLGARTSREFTVSGTPVQGTAIPAGAPLLTPGQYTDTSVASTSEETEKYYRVKRTQPGSTIRVNILARMPGANTKESNERAGWVWSLKTFDDDSCDNQTSSGQDGYNTGVVVGQTLLSMGRDPKPGAATPPSGSEKCAEAKELYFNVKRIKGTGGETPIEIRVIEEAPMENAGQLPAGVVDTPSASDSGAASPASGDPTSVVGGASFNDALEVGSGTYSTEVVPGEMVFFKTPIKYGQNGVFSLDGLEVLPEVIQGATPSDDAVVSPAVYAPDLSRMDSHTPTGLHFSMSKTGARSSGAPHIDLTPEVRYRNRWDSPKMYYGRSLGFSMEGYYYYALALGQADFLKGQPTKIQFSLKVSGEVSDVPGETSDVAGEASDQEGDAQPTWAYTSGFDSPDQAAASADPGKLLMLAGGGVLVILGGGGIAYVLLRRPAE